MGRMGPSRKEMTRSKLRAVITAVDGCVKRIREAMVVMVVVCGVWCVVCGVWCVVCGVWCVGGGEWWGVWGV